jgi:hypothetical protein
MILDPFGRQVLVPAETILPGFSTSFLGGHEMLNTYRDPLRRKYHCRDPTMTMLKQNELPE